MAISIRATGTYAENAGNASFFVTIPAGAVSGDMMLCFIGGKPFGTTFTMPAGWTSVGSATNGTTASGGDTGSMKVQCYYKQHTGTESTPTVTLGTTDVTAAVIIVFQKTTGTWGIVGTGGGDTTSGTNFICNGASVLDIIGSDMMVGYGATPTNSSTQSTIGMSATGLTMGTFTEAPTLDFTTSTNNDMSMSGGYQPVSSGTATGAPAYISTLSAATTGTAFMVRLREVAATTTTTAGPTTTTTTVAPGPGAEAGTIDPVGMLGFFGL
jgi:hypothetical protein